MKHMQILAQEPYEAPAILDIAPITVAHGEGGTPPQDPDEHDEGDY